MAVGGDYLAGAGLRRVKRLGKEQWIAEAEGADRGAAGAAQLPLAGLDLGQRPGPLGRRRPGGEQQDRRKGEGDAHKPSNSWASDGDTYRLITATQ
jgi:hypothetical protein